MTGWIYGLDLAAGADLLLRLTLLLAVAVVADAACGRRRAAWRSLLWKCAVVAVLLLPLARVLLPEVAVGVAPSSPVADVALWAGAPDVPVPPASATTPETPAAFPSAAPVPSPAVPASPVDVATVAAAVYLLGAGLLLGRLGLGLLVVGRLVRRAQAVTDPRWTAALARARGAVGVDRVRLRCSHDVDGPLVVGLVWPTVLIPTAQVDGVAGRAAAILTHELQHVRRRDTLFNLLACVGQALYWIHPLMWYTGQRLRTTAEQACDDATITTLGDHEDYAKSLLALGTVLRRRPAVLAAGMARPRRVLGRVRRIAQLGGAGAASGPRGRALLMTVAVACVALAGSVVPASHAALPGYPMVLTDQMRAQVEALSQQEYRELQEQLARSATAAMSEQAARLEAQRKVLDEQAAQLREVAARLSTEEAAQLEQQRRELEAQRQVLDEKAAQLREAATRLPMEKAAQLEQQRRELEVRLGLQRQLLDEKAAQLREAAARLSTEEAAQLEQQRRELEARVAQLGQARQRQQRLEALAASFETASTWATRLRGESDWDAATWRVRSEAARDFDKMAVRAFNARHIDLGLVLADRGLQAHPLNGSAYWTKWSLLLTHYAVEHRLSMAQIEQVVHDDLDRIDAVLSDKPVEIWDASTEQVVSADAEHQRRLRDSIIASAYRYLYRWSGRPAHLDSLRVVRARAYPNRSEDDPQATFAEARLATDPATRVALLREYLEELSMEEPHPGSGFARLGAYQQILTMAAESPGLVDDAQAEAGFLAWKELLGGPHLRQEATEQAEYWLLRADYVTAVRADAGEAQMALAEFAAIDSAELAPLNERIGVNNDGEPWVPYENYMAYRMIVRGDLARLAGDEARAEELYRQALARVRPFIDGWSMKSELWIADELKSVRRRLQARLDDPVLEDHFYHL